MEKKAISIEERKKIQLEMLTELDKFCRDHSLRYVLAYGTLLGAIRHKGYIPWDDDVDIIMPYEDMLYLKHHIDSELMYVVNAASKEYYPYPFPRLVHKGSFSKIGKRAKSHGVYIDLYVMIPCTENISKQALIVNRLKPLFNCWRLVNRAYLCLLRETNLRDMPGVQWLNRIYEKQFREKLLDNNGKNFFCISGPLRTYKNETFDYNLFESIIDVDFENRKFMAPACYDKCLTQFYGDYMTPPPADKQIPYHGGEYYWK